MSAQQDSILILGSAGQIGTDLVYTLREQLGGSKIIAADVKDQQGYLRDSGPFYILDVLDTNSLAEIVNKHQVKEVYLLAALLSAVAEQKVKSAWKLNMEGLFNVLDLAKEKGNMKVFWPSSIAVFGPTTPRHNTPQFTVMEPTTVYGISKLAGERWCEYYFKKYNVDVRSVRYPGLISYKAHAGGGTTDYAVDIYPKALENAQYECYLKSDTELPMMYMTDALRATLELMGTDASNVKIRGGYNIAGMSFTPAQVAEVIKQHIPDFKISYKPDSRQQIADSWPASIDDQEARKDWGWKPQFDLERMSEDMFKHLKELRDVVPH